MPITKTDAYSLVKAYEELECLKSLQIRVGETRNFVSGAVVIGLGGRANVPKVALEKDEILFIISHKINKLEFNIRKLGGVV